MTPDVPSPDTGKPIKAPPSPGGASVDGVVGPAPAPQQSAAKTQPAVLAPSNLHITSGVAQPPKPLVDDAAKFASRVQGTKRVLVALFGMGYFAFMCWGLFLLAVLPSADDQLRKLIPLGLLSAVIGGGFLLLLGLFLFQRVSRSDVSARARQFGMAKIILIVLPGLALSGLLPMMITREPTLYLEITDPTSADDFVAPVSVTLSAKTATETLRKLNLKAVKYQWDTNSDGKMDEETVEPKATVLFDRAVVQNVSVSIVLEGGKSRKVVRRITIPRAVFDTSPLPPIVDRPVKFNILKLLADPKLLSEVTWDFGDGSSPKTSKTTDVVHTFYTTDRVTVTATVKFTNNTQQVFKRDLVVQDPPPLQFPATLTTEPKNLVAPFPLGVTFTVQTDEPVKDIIWNFDEGKEEHGADLRRISHLFNQPGSYFVTAKIRSESGKLDELSVLVRATEVLQLNDLTFVGQPPVQNNSVVRGEVPLTVQLTPKTSIPLVQFSWEDAEGTAVQGQNPAVFQKVYRKEGTYKVSLIAQSADGKAIVLPLTIQVDPPSADPEFAVKPESGSAPLTVNLDASSTFVPPGQEIAGFEWTFGDEVNNQKPVLGAARVEHTYKEAGEYTIQLRVVMTDGKDFKATRKLVVRRPTLSSCFTASRTTVQVGKGVEFEASCSVGTPTSYLWDIRGNDKPDLPLGQSAERGYSFVFDTPGTYQVTLTLADAFENKDSKTVEITVTP